MLHVLRVFSVSFQWLPIAFGDSMRHACDMTKRTSATRDRGDADVRALLEVSEAERIASYDARGRKFETLGETKLMRAWVAAFAHRAQAPHDRTRNDLHDDLSAKLHIRNIELPVESVKDDFQRLSDNTRKRLDTLIRDDPELVTQMENDLQADLAAMKRKPKQ